MAEIDALRWTLTAAYIALLGLIGIYGLHRYWLVYLYNKHRRQVSRPSGRFGRAPRVTVQLPLYNEGAVAERIIDAACSLDYPADRLQIQVLDDSTDGSVELVRRRVDAWSARGVDIELLHRTDRHGFKAGALAHAMRTTTGELIAIFDADFIPPAGFLRRTVHYFTDPPVGMVQTRWSHLNRRDSLLTRGQAIFLDGHFIVEHTARNRSGAWINFNGTAGIWRRAAIEAAGGWQHDTLTEDVDLSYRAQLAGWRFVFLPQVTCPAELPPEINAFKSQQHRWTKGSIQTALKLMPALFGSNAGWRIKIEAFFHLTSPMVYVYITLLALLFYPAIYVNLEPLSRGAWPGFLIGLLLFGLGTASATIFYITSQRAQHRSVWSTLIQVPMLMAIGIGIALNNAVACVEALVGHDSPFIRTPKYNRGSDGARAGAPGPDGGSSAVGSPLERIIPIPSMRRSMCLLELLMGCYMAECARLSIEIEYTIVSLPFLILFGSGYFYVGLTSLWAYLRAWLNRGTVGLNVE